MKNSIYLFTCIDDYGLGKLHNKAIRNIIRTGLISGVTTFVGKNDSSSEAAKLLPVANNANCQIGLHLDFLEFFPFIDKPSFISSDKFCALFILFNLLGLTNKNEISESIKKQIKIFKDIFKRPPDFIDGHYHLHQISSVRKILIDVLQKEKFNGWLRTTNMGYLKNNFNIIDSFKIAYLKKIGNESSLAFLNHFKTNSGFGGYCELGSSNNYASKLRNELSSISSSSLFMLHPGSSEDVYQIDSHSPRARDIETDWLLNNFEKDCKESDIQITKDFNKIALL